MSVRLFVCISTSPTGRTSAKIYIDPLYENISKKLMFFLKNGQKYGELYIQNQVFSIFSVDYYRQKDPLFKGRGISFMLADVV